MFSVTAPKITPDDETRELEALSSEERDALEREIVGTEAFHETEEMKAQGSILFAEAIAAIPEHNKRDYLEAMKRVSPLVMEHESNPIAFMRTQKYDASVRLFVCLFV
jgi:hypothetical protein